MFCFLVSGCQYQCNRLPRKTLLRNDLLCVEWDVKPYTLTHSFIACICLEGEMPEQYRTIATFVCRRVMFYQFVNNLQTDRQVNCERLEHPDDHTDLVLLTACHFSFLIISRFLSIFSLACRAIHMSWSNDVCVCVCLSVRVCAWMLTRVE